jgi:hypothetical protein
VQLDGALVLTQAVVAKPQVAQINAFSRAVAGFPIDGQRLGVQLDGALVLTQAAVAKPQVTQAVAFALAVAGIPGDGQ